MIRAAGLKANTAAVTGESVPEPRDEHPDPGGDLPRARNVLLAGTTVAAGRGTAVVFAAGMRTEFGRVARLSQVAPDWPSPLRVEIARLSRVVAAF